jgi:tRNA (guanine-N7-)-methyltransferase
LPDPIPSDLRSMFAGAVSEVWLEIGFGSGEHLAHQARMHPDVGFIGCEPFVNGVAALVATIAEDRLANIRIFDEDARLLLPHVSAGSIARVFLMFLDPWPKRRHHRRRFVQPDTLSELARIMSPGAELRFASDEPSYVRWALWHVLRHPGFAWTAQGPDDWRVRWADSIATRYETKGLAGRKPAYLTFMRR